MASLKNQKYIVTELASPEIWQKRDLDFNQYAKRILWLDDKAIKGAFQMTCIWYMQPSTEITPAHTHEADEIIGFFGGDPQNPYDLGGEIEMWLEDEKYALTKSCLIFVPAGMKHCPLIIRKVDKPIFHFITVNQGQYVQDFRDAKYPGWPLRGYEEQSH